MYISIAFFLTSNSAKKRGVRRNICAAFMMVLPQSVYQNCPQLALIIAASTMLTLPSLLMSATGL